MKTVTFKGKTLTIKHKPILVTLYDVYIHDEEPDEHPFFETFAKDAEGVKYCLMFAVKRECSELVPDYHTFAVRVLDI